MTHKGVDFAFRPPASTVAAFSAALVKLGYKFVVRYISHDSSKNLTAYEIRAYRAAGLGIVTVFEDGATRGVRGGAAGVMDAKYAQTFLRGLRAPTGHAAAPVFFAFDFDMTAQQAVNCAAYMRGAAQVLGKGSCGVYGGELAIQKLGSAAAYQWQTAAWSGGRWVAGIELEQFADSGRTLGVQWDLDESLANDYGAWKFPSPISVPPPPGSGGGGSDADLLEQMEEMPVQIPAGKTVVPVPLAIPNGCTQLHFVPGKDGAELSIEFHGVAKPVPVALTWAHGSTFAEVPKKVHAALLSRTDNGSAEVSLDFWKPTDDSAAPAAPAK